jgi:SNF2 family DNA or RNA helicase
LNCTENSHETQPFPDGLEVCKDQFELAELHKRIESGGPWDHWTLFQLAYEIEEQLVIQDFDELICLRHLSQLTPLPHQLKTAQQVIHDMHGRAILADEVGLGKTIEAGIILKEYLVRGLVERVLILVPASLVLQWVRELNQKFNIPIIAHKKLPIWTTSKLIVASMDTAKKEPHRSQILNLELDMLIIDEAHKLKNKRTSNYQFINEIQKKFCLLLTATPMQNDIKELYNLVQLLKPGQLGEPQHFHAAFVQGKRKTKNEPMLQKELSKLMIRNKRSDGQLPHIERIVKNIYICLSQEEQALYEGVTTFIRDQYEACKHVHGQVFTLMMLQREVCSSRDAVFLSLVNLFQKTDEHSPWRTRIWELIEKIRCIQANTKAEKVIELIHKIPDKVIIFTEFRATQEYLLHYLKQNQITAIPYRGGMNRGKKDWMMDIFQQKAKVLIATEAGSEGINLQFCHHLINFDLPWNPMRVEQRIGRIHRLGQTCDVVIYNLSTLHTIEQHILTLLHEKINLFEKVIGQLDVIIERIEKKEKIETSLFQLFMKSSSHDEIELHFNQLSEPFQQLQSNIVSMEVMNP